MLCQLKQKSEKKKITETKITHLSWDRPLRSLSPTTSTALPSPALSPTLSTGCWPLNGIPSVTSLRASISFPLTLAAWSQPSLAAPVSLSQETASGALQTLKGGCACFSPAEKQFAPDCDHQAVLWLALGRARALQAAGTWRCSHGQHYFHSSKFQEKQWELKLQIIWSAVFDQLMNAHDSGDWIS